MPYQRHRVPIGQRREKVALQAAVATDDGMGGQTIVKWQTVGEPWANVTALDERQREALLSQQVTALHAYHITVSYRADLSPAMRLQWRNRTLQIHTVTDDEQRRRRLVLLCLEAEA